MFYFLPKQQKTDSYKIYYDQSKKHKNACLNQLPLFLLYQSLAKLIYRKDLSEWVDILINFFPDNIYKLLLLLQALQLLLKMSHIQFSPDPKNCLKVNGLSQDGTDIDSVFIQALSNSIACESSKLDQFLIAKGISQQCRNKVKSYKFCSIQSLFAVITTHDCLKKIGFSRNQISELVKLYLEN